jgi:hypothetical protein
MENIDGSLKPATCRYIKAGQMLRKCMLSDSIISFIFARNSLDPPVKTLGESIKVLELVFTNYVLL